MKQILTIIRFYTPPILWAGFIFILSSHQHVTVSRNYWFDFTLFKTLHMIEYGTLFILIYRAIFNTTSLPKMKIGIIALLFTILYAISDEIHQLFIPTREGKVRDVIFDTIGALFAWYFLWKLLPNLPQKLKDLAKGWQLF